MFSERTQLEANVYFDRTLRDLRNGFQQDLDTSDVELRLLRQLGARQQVVAGLEVREMEHDTVNLALFRFLPAHETQYLYSLFINDEITLVPQRWRLTVGSKFEDTHYTGIEYQPSIRLAYTPSTEQIFWGAISRAVRTPSRIDRDFFLNLTPTLPLVVTGGFAPEKLLAYELGWRDQPRDNLSLSAAAFFNEYEDLRSAEPGPPPLGIPITFANGVEGDSYGLELTATYQVLSQWRLRAGYTYFHKDLEIKASSRDLNNATSESNDPENQLLLQSTFDVTRNLELDWVARYVDRLPSPRVPSYVSLDLRIGWRVGNNIELSLVGQNLLDGEHPEFIPASPSPREIERSFYARFSWRP
jgi:iron complex outermembrane receptor protein